MWIIKLRLEDFIVVEDIDIPENGDGVYLYFLKKQGRTTLSVVKELYRRYDMKKGDISFAGMKDSGGVTYQYLSISHDIGQYVKTDTYTLWKIGQISSFISRDMLKGNYFHVYVRGAYNVDTFVLGNYFINYFDYQRFAVFSEGIAARLILKKRFKEALWTLLTPGTRSMIKEQFDNEDFKACRKLARTPWERRLFDFLRRKGPKYRDALRYVDGDQRAISMLAYQSYLWNKTVSYLVEKYGDEIRYIEVAGQQLAISPKLKKSFKVPFITWFLSEEWWDLEKDVRDALMYTLEEEGFSDLYELKTKIYGYTLILRYRDMLAPVNQISRVDDKEGPHMVFYLTKGSYATMYLKHLAALHDERLIVAS